MRQHSWLVCTASSLALFFPTAASAQSPDLQAVIACSNITEDAARLACYDEAVAPLTDISDDLVVVNRSEVEAVEQDGFGLELPSLPNLSFSLFGGRSESSLEEPAEDEAAAPGNTAEAPRQSEVLSRTNGGQIDEIRLQLAEIERRGYDDVFFVMVNGQVWEHVGGPDLRRSPNFNRGPVYVEIRRASMGSYLLRVNGSGAAYRVVRRE
ncbi:hypothetical protein [Oceanicaulis sp. MMSF_3324]|uniref:hypothetical protein n=1 Tax=Oceanicaulis sp. MMSF_3324 TaxID=3046702 RepID=UPI00273D032A|nr:hypothetical protein [Oceanicaulis sp. MMSF_3324]